MSESIAIQDSENPLVVFHYNAADILKLEKVIRSQKAVIDAYAAWVEDTAPGYNNGCGCCCTMNADQSIEGNTGINDALSALKEALK